MVGSSREGKRGRDFPLHTDKIHKVIRSTRVEAIFHPKDTLTTKSYAVSYYETILRRVSSVLVYCTCALCSR